MEEKYPALKFMIRYGNQLTCAAAGLVFLAGISSGENRLHPLTLARSVGMAIATGLAVKNLTELNQIISDALLPQ